MTPAQRLAEWLDQDTERQVDIYYYTPAGGWFCRIEDGHRAEFESDPMSRDAAITAALDAWQKGDG